jgi:membrane associated rhomboid family serine protease
MSFNDIHRPLSESGFRGAVRWIITISGILLIGQQFSNGLLETWLGLTPELVTRHYYLWQLITYPFLHGGLFHWLFNMFVFWAFGGVLERQWGTAFFLRFFFVTTIGAGLCVLAISPHAMAPTIGSSGAVFGTLVAFAMLYPDSVMYLYFLIPVKAWQAAVLFGLVEFFAVAQSHGSALGRLAHLAGMVFAYLYVRFGTTIDHRVGRIFTLPRFSMARKSKGIQLHEATDDLVAEVDRILTKVSREGADSLTAKEKEIMERYTRSRHARTS